MSDYIARELAEIAAFEQAPCKGEFAFLGALWLGDVLREAELERRERGECKHCSGSGRFPNANKCYCCDGRGWRSL